MSPLSVSTPRSVRRAVRSALGAATAVHAAAFLIRRPTPRTPAPAPAGP
ncbi:hypothetical protein [Streptomyces sp. NRRL F-4489]|nr:hypothetical protein [Streptomyces sp. NRRL F-4489]